VCDPATNKCVACLKDGDCPAGAVCSAKACVPGCTSAHPCGDAGVCDPSTNLCKGCVSDGDCNGPTPRCDTTAGTCVACLPMNDNCSLGSYCAQVAGSWSCQTGCKVDNECQQMAPPDGGASDGGPIDANFDASPVDAARPVDGSASDGGPRPARLACCNHACTDVTKDGLNCGACGTSCMVGQSCCGASCIPTTMDVTNCGGCGVTCAGQHANWACAASACAISSCAMGYADCDKMASDGCESLLATDVNNCGSCGAPCTPTSNAATMGCAGSTCNIATCKPPFADCDKLAPNGCEVNTTGDVNNCSGCGKSCLALANVAAAACTNGNCTNLTCKPPFADCNGIAADGCETNLNTDKNHCGACTKPCGPASCINGQCVNQTLIQTVCGLSNPPSAGFANGIFCSGNCTVNHAQYAQAYCQLAGFTTAVSYTVLTSGSVACIYYNANGNPSAVPTMCSQLILFPTYGLVPGTCDAVTDLVCQ
jgi:hypothetical protein